MTMLQRAKKVGRKFQNPVPTELGGLGLMVKVLPLYLRSTEEKAPRVTPGPFRTDVSVYTTAAESGLRVTWFGHSSMLVEIDGIRVLIDPVWDDRAAPVQWFGPKRFFAPTVRLEDLPAVDVVLISHDHYDHLGKGTIRALAQMESMSGARWVTSVGVGKVLRDFGVEEVIELDWTQSTVVAGAEPGVTLEITSLPTRHFSGRGLFNRMETLWGSFVLRGARHRVYFGADSGWWDGFAEIGKEYGPFDLTMLEIGAYHPLWSGIHLGAEGALRAFAAMGGQGLVMPIHWGLFDLALHGWRQPIDEFLRVARDRGVAVWAPEPGLPTEVSGEGVCSGWWRRA